MGQGFTRGEKEKSVRKEKGRVGSGVLSHTVSSAVPSALMGLTAGFGMEPGGPPWL
jgi:hypothetical protein